MCLSLLGLLGGWRAWREDEGLCTQCINDSVRSSLQISYSMVEEDSYCISRKMTPSER